MMMAAETKSRPIESHTVASTVAAIRLAREMATMTDFVRRSIFGLGTRRGGRPSICAAYGASESRIRTNMNPNASAASARMEANALASPPERAMQIAEARSGAMSHAPMRSDTRFFILAPARGSLYRHPYADSHSSATVRDPRLLSLIHLSEPTRPY